MSRFLKSNRLRRLVSPTATLIRRSPALLSLIRAGKRGLNGADREWQIGPDIVDPQYQINFRAMLPPGFTGRVGFIASRQDPIIHHYARSLDLLGLDGELIDPVQDDFHERVLSSPARVFLCRPTHFTNQQRQMFWEKTLPLYGRTDAEIYPSRQSLNIYEAKRELAYFLKVNRIPHPETHIFYELADALAFSRCCQLPQVFKTNTGSSATGVEILRDRPSLVRFIRDVFRKHYIKHSLSDYRDMDYGHVILQQYLHRAREFRIIKVGDSWFGHEKLPGAESEMMSGSGVNAWTPPSHELLDFCAELAGRFRFHTMCFDVFRTDDGRWLVNELQAWFGSYNNSQMYIDGVPGRYIRQGRRWDFQPGFYNQYRSLPLIIASSIAHASTR